MNAPILYICVPFILLSLNRLCKSQNACQKTFDRNSDAVEFVVSAPKAHEPLTCGFRERTVFFYGHSTKEEVGDDGKIDWNAARCLDEHTLSFKFSRMKAMMNPEIADSFDSKKYFLTIQCIGVAPIRFTYDGILPSVGNILTSTFSSSKNTHVTTAYIPYLDVKSGNYSFELVDFNRNDSLSVAAEKTSQWIYIIFEAENTGFYSHKPVADAKFEVGMYKDPRNSTNIIVPCKLSSPESKVHYLFGYFANGNRTMLPSFEAADYDPRWGLIIERKKAEELFHNTVGGESKNRMESVGCVNPENSSDIALVKVNLGERHDHEERPKLISPHSKLVLVLNNQRLYCSKENNNGTRTRERGFITNVRLLTSSELQLLFKCSLKKTFCDWNSHWTETGQTLELNRRVKNKKARDCVFDLSSPCTILNPYKFGVMRCSTEDEREFVSELHFTGLDNQMYLFREWKNVNANVLIDVSRYVSRYVSQFDLPQAEELYSNDIRSFSCRAVYFLVSTGYIWRVKFKNGTETNDSSIFLDGFEGRYHTISLVGDTVSRLGHTEIIRVKVQPDMVEVNCKALLRDSGDQVLEGRLRIDVKVKMAPNIVHSESTKIVFSPKEIRPVLNCFVLANPDPEIKWTRIVNNRTEVLMDVEIYKQKEGSFRAELRFTNSTSKLITGIYTCSAQNSEGAVKAEFVVDVREDVPMAQSKLWAILGSSLGMVTVLVIVVAFVVVYKIKQNSKRILTKEDVEYFLNGDATSKEEQNEEGVVANNYACLPYKNSKEADPKDFSIDTDCVLGSGFYGMVLKAKLRETDVAAKTVKPNTERDVLLALLAEIKIMSHLEEHPYIVSLVGAHTTNLAKGQVYLFVELCPLGSVESYLRKNKDLLLKESNKTHEESESKLIMEYVTLWSFQTAEGMKYLSERRVIHGDLAVRNLLLKDMRTVKITDFGLARQLQNYSIYKKTQQQPLPWRHMSPESLSAMEFSVKSDVWAFGVTMWEMYSLGAIPYSGMQWTVGFTAALEGGLRLEKPLLCPHQAFALMKVCWNLDSRHRPDFNELSLSLKRNAESVTSDEYVDLGGQ